MPHLHTAKIHSAQCQGLSQDMIIIVGSMANHTHPTQYQVNIRKAPLLLTVLMFAFIFHEDLSKVVGNFAEFPLNSRHRHLQTLMVISDYVQLKQRSQQWKIVLFESTCMVSSSLSVPIHTTLWRNLASSMVSFLVCRRGYRH